MAGPLHLQGSRTPCAHLCWGYANCTVLDNPAGGCTVLDIVAPNCTALSCNVQHCHLMRALYSFVQLCPAMYSFVQLYSCTVLDKACAELDTLWHTHTTFVHAWPGSKTQICFFIFLPSDMRAAVIGSSPMFQKCQMLLPA